jgi:anti-sigma factor RsiW
VRHLTDSEMAGYLDHDLSDEERRRVVQHLDTCDVCRAEVVATSRLLAEDMNPAEAPAPLVPAARRRWRARGAVGLATAAALAAILLVRPEGVPRGQGAPELERFTTEGVDRLAVVAPSDEGAVRRDDLRFIWADRGTGSYRITITAEDGRPVWSQALADTTVVPPPTLDLTPGERFFWYVDAISAGVVARSGAHSFVVAP